MNLPHVILYKDYLYYDDVDEFLKRYYTHDEAIPRIENLSKFYMTMHENINKPNLAIHEQNDIILKRNNRHHKLFLAKLNNFDGLPQTHRLQNQALEDSEDYTDSNEDSSDSESTGQKKILGNILGGEEERVHNSFQRELDQYPDYEVISYDSHQHDMYNPKSSSSESSQGSGSTAVLPTHNIIRSRLAVHSNLENRGGAIPVEPQELDESLSVIIKHEERGTKDSVFDIYEMDHIDDDDASNLSLGELSEVNVAERLMTNMDESSGVRSPRDFIKYQRDNWRQNVDDELEKLIDDRLIMESMKTQKPIITESTPMSTAGMEGESHSGHEGVSQKTIPKLKKPLVPKMNITNSGSGRSTDKKPRKTVESEERKKLENQKTIKTATSPFNSVRVVSEEDNRRRVQTEEHLLHAAASTYRNQPLKGEIPKSLYASSSTTRLLPKPQPQAQQMSDRKVAQPMKVPQRIQKNNENKIPHPEEVTPMKKSIKSIPQIVAKNNLGINLQSCYSKDKGTCLEQLTALQAPKHSDHNNRLVGKLSIPKLTTSPRSPMKSKSHKLLKPRTDSKEDLLRHHKTEEKDINITERLKTIKKIFDKNTHYQQANTTGKKYHIGAGLGRSKTEEALLPNMSERSLRTDTKAPLSKTQRQKIDSSLKALTSFGKTKNKEITSSQKSLAKEPSLRDFISLANMRQLQNSSDISKSLREFHHIHQSDEKQFYSSQKVTKNKSAKSLHKQIKSKGKASIKSSKSKPLSKDVFDYNSVATRRTTAGPHTTIPSFSAAKGHNLGSLPISPEKRTLNVNVSLKQLGSHGHKSVNDHTMDNSYGFWTSRSSKGNVDEPVNNLTATKGLAKTSSSKYVLHTEGDHSGEKNPAEKRFHTDHNLTKPKVSKTRKATKVSMFQQFKETENEMLRNIKHLKPNYMLSAWPRGNQNKSLEEKEGTMVNGSHTTTGYISHIVPNQKSVKKTVKKGKKKAVAEGAK